MREEAGILTVDLHGKNVYQARVTVDALLRRAGGGVDGRQRRTTGWPADRGRLSNAGGDGSPALGAGAAFVRHGDDEAT